MNYLISFAIFAAIELVFYLVAKKISLGAKVCERSSHEVFTPTSGGTIFLIATIFFCVSEFTTLSTSWLTMLCGATALGVISLIDDYHPLPAKPRLAAQILVTALIFSNIAIEGNILLYLLFVFCGVGCINTFNFIDGICGILAMYTAVVIATLICAFNIYAPAEAATYAAFGNIMLCAIAAFALFNLPDKMFAGDVGAITLGVIVMWMLFNFMYITGDITAILLIIVCVYDIAATMVQRLYAGENILTAHCKNLYHVLTRKWQLPHLVVAGAYTAIQAVISVVYFVLPTELHSAYFVAVVGILTVIYTAIRKSKRSGKF